MGIKINVGIYKGRSKHPILSQSGDEFLALVFASQMECVPWWKRFLKPIPVMTKVFAEMAYQLSKSSRGQTLVAEVRPEPAYFSDDENDRLQTWLLDQLKASPRIQMKGDKPTKYSRATGGNTRQQYIFEIDGVDQLAALFQSFDKYEMMNLFALDVDVNLQDFSRHLQEWYLDHPFALDAILDNLNACIYCSHYGDRLIIESQKYNILERFLEEQHLEPASIPMHPHSGDYGRSLWIGGHRLFP